ncbi:sarcocystatin-A [Stomoxys calcitrans]|uniref:sarcocystatin-A n=1 Tax=Stomoxys calcitrans TaxID=35570 RepID=UPI0027E2620B|nr:sarcocystatin-A [Stomoxys calcitrans]XP_059219058.1 sarcocystatin-A [Stomoxys calcitrans]XP_059219059.1 sarcocystatin-A [Stomoxys calcitrans]
MKLVIIFILATLAVVNGFMCAGCPSQMDPEQAKEVLNNTLNKVATLGGPNYSVGKIYTASSQITSGVKYRMNADLLNDSNQSVGCDVVIERTAATGITKVTFNCSNRGVFKISY